jgi:hypothetical protein
MLGFTRFGADVYMRVYTERSHLAVVLIGRGGLSHPAHFGNAAFSRSTVWRHFGVVGWHTEF